MKLKDISIEKLTPMMQQYMSIKEEVMDSILLYRLGDFYEMFFDDAVIGSKLLGLALTGRDCGLEERAPMCGIPYHVSITYIKKLVDAGKKVAICEQLEDPSLAKGLVKRGIVKIYTPGTILEEELLSKNSNNFIASIFIDDFISICYSDISTGELYLSKTISFSNNLQYILNEISRINPREIIINTDRYDYLFKNLFIDIVYLDNQFEHAKYDLKDLIENKIGFSVPEDYNETAYKSLYNLFYYFIQNKIENFNHITKINEYDISRFLQLDESCIRNLELTRTIHSSRKEGSLFECIDNTVTAKGSRKLKSMIEQPLYSLSEIENRLNSVEIFFNNPIIADSIRKELVKTYDIERILSKISNQSATPNDLKNLKLTIKTAPVINNYLNSLAKNDMNLNELRDLFELIDTRIDEDAPSNLSEGNVIKRGFNSELDELKSIKNNFTEFLLNYENDIKEKSNIKTLRLKYNKVHGHFIEISKGQAEKAPSYFYRIQTLKNVERYKTDDLRDMEYKMQNALQASLNLEREIYLDTLNEVFKYSRDLINLAENLSNLDIFISHAETARKNRYVRPKFNTNGKLYFKNGRHPVIEMNKRVEDFIPNDVLLEDEKNFAIITGPNMSGKSTYMRQIALNVILAQMGSYVACDEADICIFDKLFTRIGASDSIRTGQSTFMVEMSEVSYIVKNATKKSLILLDEVGRGTSTYDGMSIARAILEYIALNINAKTLFSTHYQELSSISDKINHVFNLTLETKEVDNKVLFLRKVKEGVTNKSYGIHVAKMAGLPNEIIVKSQIYLKELEDEGKRFDELSFENDNYIDFISENDDREKELLNNLKEELTKININDITPLDALMILKNLKDEVNDYE